MGQPSLEGLALPGVRLVPRARRESARNQPASQNQNQIMNVKLELYRGQATETVLSTGTYSSITEAHDAALHAIRRLWRVPGQVRWRIRDFDSGRILGEGGSNDPAPLPPKITASAAFLDERNAIADVLNRLASLCDDHFGVVPDDVTWADVGSLEHYREGLEAVAACAFQEHAAPGEEVEA